MVTRLAKESDREPVSRRRSDWSVKKFSYLSSVVADSGRMDVDVEKSITSFWCIEEGGIPGQEPDSLLLCTISPTVSSLPHLLFTSAELILSSSCCLLEIPRTALKHLWWNELSLLVWFFSGIRPRQHRGLIHLPLRLKSGRDQAVAEPGRSRSVNN